MRQLLTLGFLVTVLAPSPASAAPPRYPRFGMAVDAGVPDGAHASVTVRPLGWLRLDAGGSYNLVSPGIRAGVSLVPFYRSIITPSLVLTGGHFFPGRPAPLEDEIESLAYDFFDAHLGLELGGRWFTFYLQGGRSYISGNVDPADMEEVTFNGDIQVRAWIYSARLGFVVYFAE